MEPKVGASTDDPGFFVLKILLRLLGMDIKSEQLRQDINSPAVGVEEMVSYAKIAGLAARCSKTTWERLPDFPLPAIAPLRDGSFLLLGKVTGETAVVLAPRDNRATLMTRAEFQTLWDGRLLSMRKRGACATRFQQSGKTSKTRLQRFGRTSITRANDISRRLVGQIPQSHQGGGPKKMAFGRNRERHGGHRFC